MAIAATTSLEGPQGTVTIDPTYKARLTKGFETNKSKGELVHFTYRLTKTDEGKNHDLFFEVPDGESKMAMRTTTVERSGTTVRHDLKLIRKKGLPKLETYEITQEAVDSLGDVLEDSTFINAD